MKRAPRPCVWLTAILLAALAGFDTGTSCTSPCPELRPGAVWALPPATQPDPVNEFTLNALDYRRCIYDFRRGGLGTSRQIDEKLREFIGDVAFTGKEFTVLENERYTGTFLDLGEERKPDDEFSWFYSLRLYQRLFQARQFPFHDRYRPCPEIDSRGFFTTRDPVTSVNVGLSHLYALRLHHRTKVGDERVFLLRVIEFVPGVQVTVLWRELEIREDS